MVTDAIKIVGSADLRATAFTDAGTGPSRVRTGWTGERSIDYLMSVGLKLPANCRFSIIHKTYNAYVKTQLE